MSPGWLGRCRCRAAIPGVGVSVGVVTRRPWRAPVLLAYAAFVLVGVNAGVNGVLLAAQMDDYAVSRATLGLTFFASSAGFVLAGVTAGALIHRFGTRI